MDKKLNCARETFSQRNGYIDYLRGVAALGIVAIHTAFWSGQSYTPPWFWNLTLFLDVPFFFYLSGWGTSYKKGDLIRTGKSLLSIWLKWVFYVSILAIFCFISKWLPISFQGVTDLKDLVNNYMFNVSVPGFCVVAGSIWFMPYYIVVVFINNIVLIALQNSSKREQLQDVYMWTLMSIFVWVSFGKYFLGLDVVYFSFYGFFWMLGFRRIGKVKNIKKLLFCMLIFVSGICISSYLQGLPLYDIQSAKFPPTIKYGFVSIISIFLAKFMEEHIGTYNKALVHIGKNAIFYYFGQGIGSSLSYYFINAVSLEVWYLKWFLTFLFNIAVTAVIAEIIALLYRRFCALINLLWKEKNTACR
ncbi:acyltransferase family protein [Lawsonibacter sp. LCP25S3_F5]